MNLSPRQHALRFFALSAVVLGVPLALSARDASRDKAIVSGDTAYLLETSRQIVPAHLRNTSVSPDGRYLLAFSEDPPLIKTFPDLQTSWFLPRRHTLTLSLYEVRTGRTTVLRTWNNDETVVPFPDKIKWFADNDTAAVSLSSAHLPPGDLAAITEKPTPNMDADLLLVHCARQSVQMLPLLVAQTETPSVLISPSPTRPEAIVRTSDSLSKQQSMRLLTAKGFFSAPITDAALFFGFNGWDKTGDTGSFTLYREAADASSKGRLVYYLWNRATKTLTEQEKRPVYEEYRAQVPAYAPPDAPLRFVSEHGDIQTESGAKSGAMCAVAASADNKDRVVIAANADAVSVVGKAASPVLLYKQNDALYAVPTRTVTEAAFAEYLRGEAAESVRTIGVAISMYSQDYDEAFPLPTHDVAKDIEPYLESRTSYLDPRTGVNAFTYTYTGKADASGRKSLFSYKTTTGTIRAFLTPDGNVVTDPPTAPKP